MTVQSLHKWVKAVNPDHNDQRANELEGANRAAIKLNVDNDPIPTMCYLLGESRSECDESQRQPLSEEAFEDLRLLETT